MSPMPKTTTSMVSGIETKVQKAPNKKYVYTSAIIDSLGVFEAVGTLWTDRESKQALLH